MNSEKIFRYLLVGSGILVVLIAIGIVTTLFIGSIPSIKHFGFGFIFSSEWNPTEGREAYGALPSS